MILIFKKNDELQVEITDNGMNFEGIARCDDDKVVFIKEAIKGEKVQAKIIKVTNSYYIAKLNKIVKKSTFRKTPICEVFGRCGGCSTQHIDYLYTLELKKKIVENLLNKQKVTYKNLDNTIGMGTPWYYRNKVQYPVSVDKTGNMQIGFYGARSHEIVTNKTCYINNEKIEEIAKICFETLKELKFTGYNEDTRKGDIRHIIVRDGYHTDETMLTIVVASKNIFSIIKFKKFIEVLLNKVKVNSIFLNLNDKNTNKIMGDEILHIYGSQYISDYIGEYKYYISPKSFFQVNTLQAEVLYSVLKEKLNIQKSDVIFDLYSGVGSIGIFLSDLCKKVYGIEIEESAVKMANLNMKENNVENAEYIAGSVEDKIVEFKERNIKPEIIVVDPPRKGLDEKSIEYILQFNPKKIGYVSCNPATLTRDLKLLENKYNIEHIIPVDLFPNTSHVECVSVLERK